jgi:hypothetical protein
MLPWQSPQLSGSRRTRFSPGGETGRVRASFSGALFACLIAI